GQRSNRGGRLGRRSDRACVPPWAGDCLHFLAMLKQLHAKRDRTQFQQALQIGDELGPVVGHICILGEGSAACTVVTCFELSQPCSARSGGFWYCITLKSDP